MRVLGRHLIVELTGCNVKLLDDVAGLGEICKAAALEAGATIVETVTHKYAPQGVSVVVVIAESHLSIHTWPERGYVALDIFTCGQKVDPWKALFYIRSALGATGVAANEIKRGIPSEEDEVIPHK